MDKEKKIARTSNLAIRFYQHDGWTLEELTETCVRGSFSCSFPEDERPYFTLTDPSSSYDVDKLLDKIEEIVCAYRDQEKLTKRQLLIDMNW